MTAAEKKTHIKKLIAGGDKRSYNELQADVEIQIWNERHGGSRHSQPNMPPLAERWRENKIKLEKQLKSGEKPNKFGSTKEKKDHPKIPLTEKDKKRIIREIVRLDSKIQSN